MDWGGLEYLVVGAGLSGLTVAERLHAAGCKVAVVERRDELGGLCASYADADTGIEVHRYGTHVWHTGSEAAAEWMRRLSLLDDYRHRVLARHKRRCYPWPINLLTINHFFDLDMTPRQAAGFMRVLASTYSDEAPELLRPPDGVRVLVPPCAPREPDGRRRLRELPRAANLRDACVAKMGLPLYEAFVEGYSRKQWGCDPSGLPAELGRRIPVRTDYACDLFDDPWQGLPIAPWRTVFERLAEGIKVHLGVDFNDVRAEVPPGCRVVYTGPIDAWFGYRFGPLRWRGVYFETEAHPVPDFQGAAVINECDERVPYTRTHEYRHLRPSARQSQRKTVIAREYPVDGGDPAYPVEPDGETAELYRTDAAVEPGVYFCGRLATYRYLNMDQAVCEALTLAARILTVNREQ